MKFFFSDLNFFNISRCTHSVDEICSNKLFIYYYICYIIYLNLQQKMYNSVKPKKL